MIRIALDPGNLQTAVVRYDEIQKRPVHAAIVPNNELLSWLQEQSKLADVCPELAVEMIASYGMPVGKEVFETCLWIGRFIQVWGGAYRKVYRREEKLHLCHSPKANDANIRQAIMDLYGSNRTDAIGTKKAPGPLYGISKDMWAALAIAIVASETLEPCETKPEVK